MVYVALFKLFIVIALLFCPVYVLKFAEKLRAIKVVEVNEKDIISNIKPQVMKLWHKMIIGVVTLILVLLVFEVIFYFMTPPRFRDIGFFINLRHATTQIDKLSNGFNEIDPLLGYTKTEEKFAAEGIRIENGCMVLSTTADTVGLVNILITGGSTSDISLYAKDWPVELCEILKAHGIKAKLYIAAVGGYNSGQELLKLIRDGIDCKPVVHISYSGANEISTTNYVSVYEQVFYNKQFGLGPSSWLLPNTVLFMRDLLQLNQRQMSLYQMHNITHEAFWMQNMRLMNGIARENSYTFIGVLQPVLGSGKYDQPAGRKLEAVQDYKKYYPAMRKSATAYPEFLVDLSGIFDTCKGPVFFDNCHIEDAYQGIVAADIYNSLVEREILKVHKSRKCD